MEWRKKIETSKIETSLEQLQLQNKTNIERIEEKKKNLDSKRPLSTSALQRIKEDLYIEWSYNSNSIEGNTLNLNETRMVLQEGITVKGKTFKEHLEITNHHDAIEYVEKLAKDKIDFNERDLLKIHELIMTKIEKEFAGRFRNGMVRIMGANFVPPNPIKLESFMEDYFDFIWTNPMNLNPIEMAALMHHQFVWIHPFFDGNGRTVRLIMNLYLMQKGFPPAIILKADRRKYYDALNQANNGKYEKLILIISQAIERSLDIYLMAYPDGNEYMPIIDIVEEESVPYGQEYVSLLARQGKIDAYKEGKNWYTTKEAVTEYVKNRKRKRNVS
jgi:Fic family protein